MPPYNPVALMVFASRGPARVVCCERIVTLHRQRIAVRCVLANRTGILLPVLLVNHIGVGDEIAFPIPTGDALGGEIYVSKESSSGANDRLYLAPITHVTQPKLDKRDQSFVSAQVRSGSMGISSVFLPCEIVREYFYRVGDSKNGSVSASLYQTLRIGASASPAEIRVAFKLRALELKTIGAARDEHIKLERAFNILGHPELRAHYDSLLANPEIPAAFPYGGIGSLLVAGDRSRSGETFFARRLLAFVPEQTHRRFHLSLRNCEFYPDKALCRDVRRKLQFWLDPAVVHLAWDPSWNRWKHLLNSKIEVDAVFVRSSRYKKQDGELKFVDWETGLPSRLSVKLSTGFEQEIERARTMYCRFGQYSRALDQIRLCLEHKAIERKELERMCSELGIPGDFDISQISWRPDYDPFFYRELSRDARHVYLFRNEYIFDLERAVVAETPQLGHATYVFAKPRNRDIFLALYTRATKSDIRRNHENVAERLGFLGRVVHGTNPRMWLKNIRQSIGGKVASAAQSAPAKT
jgi:hypothetical protein